MLYKNLPRGVGLRRITLHKTMNLRGEVVYLLLVECSHFMDHIGEAANLLPILRARICGYTGIFRCVDSFWQQSPLPTSSKKEAKIEALANNEVTMELAKGYNTTVPPTNTPEFSGDFEDPPTQKGFFASLFGTS